MPKGALAEETSALAKKFSQVAEQGDSTKGQKISMLMGK